MVVIDMKTRMIRLTVEKERGKGVWNYSYPNAILEDSLIYLSKKSRTIFFIVFLIILIIAVFGNLAAIIATVRRNHRFLQKTCIISLAVSDLLTAVIFSVNNLETFSHPLINWTLGEFMCHFIPFAQILGITASTFAVVIIAIDRYRNVVHALTKKWNPSKLKCLIGLTIIWLLCIGLSYPIANMYFYKKQYVIGLDGNGKPISEELMYFCVSTVKEKLLLYYLCMAILIFMTLFVIFIWLYFNIARLVWTHRKPITHRNSNNNKQDSSSTMETSTTQIRSIESPKNQQQIRSILSKNKSIHVERKIRTFKIIIALMFTFFICRIPYWIYNILKLVNTYSEESDWIVWHVFNAIGIFNCALNPFLYTFLDPTLKVLMKIQKSVNEFICKVCCCCCSNAEFEEFETENPFMVQDFERKKPNCPREVNTLRNSRVKFDDAPFIEMYRKEWEAPDKF